LIPCKHFGWNRNNPLLLGSELVALRARVAMVAARTELLNAIQQTQISHVRRDPPPSLTTENHCNLQPPSRKIPPIRRRRADPPGCRRRGRRWAGMATINMAVATMTITIATMIEDRDDDAEYTNADHHEQRQRSRHRQPKQLANKSSPNAPASVFESTLLGEQIANMINCHRGS